MDADDFSVATMFVDLKKDDCKSFKVGEGMIYIRSPMNCLLYLPVYLPMSLLRWSVEAAKISPREVRIATVVVI